MTDHPDGSVQTAVVVGCGLIGTSTALALTAAGVAVHLVDADAGHVEMAASLGAGSADPVGDADLVVVAVPPAAVVPAVIDALDRWPAAVVTDVASVKVPVCEAVGDPRFVGGHPMAGKERSGPMAASALLFEGRPWAVVPTPTSSPEAVTTLEWLATTTRAVPQRFTAADHDRAVALVSHVPHVVANLTASLLRDAAPDHLALAGPGLRDVTRIAGSDAGLWVDILSANSMHVRELLADLRDDLSALLEDPTTDRLSGVLTRGREGTRRIPGKHGQGIAELATVFVPIDDTPGQLSRLFGACGDAGINIEDMRIDHEYGREAGLVAIDVLPGRADDLVTALSARGWAAYR